jgi:hypothetical protein
MRSARNSLLAAFGLVLLAPASAPAQTGSGTYAGADASGRIQSNVEKQREAEEYLTCLKHNLLDIDENVFGKIWTFELRNTCRNDRIVSYYCAARPDLRREVTIWSGGSTVVECREEFEEHGDLRTFHRPVDR